MSNLGSTAFPLIMATLLAGLTFGLKQHVQEPDAGPAKPLRHEPDVIITQAETIRIDQSGNIKYRLLSPYMLHYVDDDTSFMQKPYMESYRPGLPTTTLQGDTADINADSSEVLMKGHVLMQRPASVDAPAMQATMDTLTIYPDDAKAHTDDPVDLRRGQSWLKGTGMSVDHDQQRFVLHQQARGSYIKTPTH